MEKNLTSNEEFNSALGKIKQDFILRLQTQVDAFKEFEKQLSNKNLDDDVASDIKMKAHKLAGSAAMFGFVQLGDIAAKIEHQIDARKYDDLQKLASDLLLEISRSAKVFKKPQIDKESVNVKSVTPKKEAVKVKKEKKVIEEESENSKSYVLVADDDETIRNLLTISLNEIDCEVVAVEDGRGVMMEVERKLPNLVILDINMPGGLSGIEVLSRLKSQSKTSEIPVIILTRESNDKTVIEGISRGAQDYVVKPFNKGELQRHVQEILQRNKIKILVADDDEMILGLLRQCFYHAGYKTIAADNGKTALDLIKKELPDLIILDVMMPAMDGFTVLQQLKANFELKNIPVIFLTAKNQHDNVLFGLEKGAADYIVKPFDIDELSARVAGILQRNKK
jgi:DNA-binding response OmpR family regulator/HPt (histidine-containing phosphotransfer) domain-containing protein